MSLDRQGEKKVRGGKEVREGRDRKRRYLVRFVFNFTGKKF